jgi:ribosomal protein S18 acetylase RimI-like enzyme
MIIRRATMNDYRGLCAILDEVDAQHREALPHVFRTPNGPARGKAYVASILEDDNARIWVAEQDGEIVGMVHVAVRQTRDLPILVPRRYAVIENLGVSMAFRRRGIGRALMQEAHRWAMRANINEIDLNVWEFNADARAFYKALGYRTASRRMWRQLESGEQPSTSLDSP